MIMTDCGVCVFLYYYYYYLNCCNDKLLGERKVRHEEVLNGAMWGTRPALSHQCGEAEVTVRGRLKLEDFVDQS